MQERFTLTDSSGRRVSILSDDESARQPPAPQETATTTSVRLPPLRNLLLVPESPNYHRPITVSPEQNPLNFDATQPALTTYASTVSAPSSSNTAPSAAAATAAETSTARVGRRPQPYICDCGRTFTRYDHFARHTDGYRRANSHTCPEPGCVAGYAKYDDLVQHYHTCHVGVGGTGVAGQSRRPE
jgi:hypothetical protein